MSKRIHSRVTINRRVAYQHVKGQGEGIILDMSLKGCRIRGVAPGLCGMRLRLQLWLPDQSQPVKVELAAIRWVQKNIFAVSFLEMRPDAQARLAQVFQLLYEAQQPEARVIQVPPSKFVGTSQEAASPGVPRGFWQPPDDL